MVIQHRRQQVVRRADGVEIAGEMQVDILHRDDLGIAAACCTALDAEDRPQGRLPQRDHDVFAQLLHAVGQADGRRRLALPGGGRVDGRDQDQLAVGALDLLEQVIIDLGLVLAVLLQILLIHPCRLRDLGDGQHFRLLRDFNIRFVGCHHDTLLF